MAGLTNSLPSPFSSPINFFTTAVEASNSSKVTLMEVHFATPGQLRMDPLLSTVQQMLGVPDELEKHLTAPTRTYIRDTKAMASTPADVKEFPSSFVFVIDMPGLKSSDIKVQVEEEKVLSITGERKRNDKEEEAEAKYIRMERRVGKFMRKFALPDNCNLEAISAACEDGVLTVTVPKISPRESKKRKTIEVKIA